jgi:hypothetical protein
MSIQGRLRAPETRAVIIEKASEVAYDVRTIGCIPDRTAEQATGYKKTAA